MKRYEITIERTLIVYADDESGARNRALSQMEAHGWATAKVTGAREAGSLSEHPTLFDKRKAPGS